MADFRLETGRLVLRSWTRPDLARFAQITNTPAVMRWLGGLLSEERLEQLYDAVIGCEQEHAHCFWLVERKADGGHLSGELLGFCGLKRGNAPDSTFPEGFEIGWRLREEAWGRGYAKEAAIASLDAGFDRFGAQEIVAITVSGNTASWGLMERLGMRRRTDLDYVDTRWEPPLCDTLAWSITAGEWRVRHD
ncbi:GNAT family N-acetyltransferase [Novosphingobium mathurense]|uniref:Protein N-acetyltransferase, RimJ/RimL family n=1 Tax=Novosphingobium mathurense TaxID=428990 RepID=A0A1U6HC47_9SPHN|nr:GNAT family N-acetyltransferase [Novosphingobium mathurense]SLJ93357.1 Protein N-acetyltransferase, RimJ/RimL family [Novosphingobium mathurense]